MDWYVYLRLISAGLRPLTAPYVATSARLEAGEGLG